MYILRPANLYGFPADWRSFRRWTLAPFDFVRHATESGEIVLRTDGSSRRSYVSLEMLARTVLDATTGRLKPGVMHVTGRSWSMLQLAQAVSEVMFGVGLERIRIRTGSQDPDETPYSFCSHILPAELDHDGSQMRAFLQSLGCYLISLGGVGNE